MRPAKWSLTSCTVSERPKLVSSRRSASDGSPSANASRPAGSSTLRRRKWPSGSGTRFFSAETSESGMREPADLEAHHVERRVHVDQAARAAARHEVDLVGLETQPPRDAARDLGGVGGLLQRELRDDRRQRRVPGVARAQRRRQVLADARVGRGHARELEQDPDERLVAADVVKVRQRAQPVRPPGWRRPSSWRRRPGRRRTGSPPRSPPSSWSRAARGRRTSSGRRGAGLPGSNSGNRYCMSRQYYLAAGLRRSRPPRAPGRTPARGVTPSPGADDEAMRPLLRCGAPSAVETVT